jgi:predicted transcriptional regulator
MRARYGEKTAKILLALTRRDMTAAQLAKAVHGRQTSTMTILLRLYQYGQVDRQKTEDGVVVVDRDEGVERPRYVYVYSITDKGHQRLEKMTGK